MKFRFFLRPGNIDAVVRNLEERASGLIAETGKGLYQLAADATPVRSGRARANWRCSVGSPDYSADGGTEFDPFRASAAFSAVKAGDTLCITNSVPYIGRLEEGWSVQAPAGIAGRALSVCSSNFESGVYLQ